MEMGIVPGTRITVNRVAPLGDPIDVLVKGYHLSLRRSEAAEVSVEVV
jgi:Fe2+ transport system protein FeoA